jgi:hypothetical protein
LVLFCKKELLSSLYFCLSKYPRHVASPCRFIPGQPVLGLRVRAGDDFVQRGQVYFLAQAAGA